MACCTGQTECNHIITIGYLKNFIGNNIQDANGNTVSVNNSDDTYCPTYAELTGGSLIPNFVDAGNGRWSKNVDGITINGSYGSNQSVKQEDLVMTYTRFEGLTITATPDSNISECSGTSTMSYTYTLRKYIKSMNGSCTVSTNDSTNRDTSDSGDAAIVYTSNQSWATVSKPTITLAKNGTHDAPARNVTITGAIRFRGTSHSATATIGQKALTGSYKYWYSAYTQYYSYDRYSVSPWDFDCNGGTWYGTGYYTRHNWDVYRWQDSCGVNYDNDTVTRNDTYPQYWEPYGSGTVDKIDCSTLSSDYSHTEYESYHGLTDFWRQECKSCSGCTDYTAYTYTDVTASCEDGSATVNYTYTAYTAHVDDAGNCTYTAGESTPGSYSVSWSCSATSSGDEHVTITGAPCCSTGTVYTYGVATIPCDSGTNVSASTTYTATTYHEDGTTTTETGPTSCTISNVECNSGSERELSTDCPFTVKQSGGCTCTAPCECTALTLASTTASVTVGSTTDVTFTAGCTTGHTVASSDDTVATATVGNGKVTITGVKAGTATITLSYTAGTTSSCSSAITTTVADPTPTCTCDNFAISPTSLEWEASSTASKEVSITESGSCISGVQVSSSNSHFTASISGSKITVTPTAATSSSEETGTLTVSYKANGSDCTPSKTVSLRHKATTCETTSCTCYVVGPATLKTGTSIASGATTAEVEWSYTAVTWTTASTCDVSSSTTTSTSSHTVTGIPTNNTCGSITRTDSFTWTGYKACDSSSACTNNDATVYWSVSQDRGKSPDDPECTGCYCSGFTLGSTPSSWDCDETDEREVSYTGDCHTDVDATSSNSHFTVTVDQTNKKIKVKPTGRYTGNTEESATITVTYKANGSSCDSQTFGVTHNSGTTCYCPDDCTSITAFSITKTSLEASGATSWVEIGSYGYNSACSDKVGVDSDKTWLSVKAENGTVYGKWDANTSFTDTRSATITAKWGTTSCTSRTGSTTQEKAECTCDDFTANAVTTAFPQTGGTITVWKIKHSCGTVEALSASCNSLITSVAPSSVSDGTEIIATANANSGKDAVTCTVGYRFKPNASSSCTSGGTEVTLPGTGACTCEKANFNVDPTSITGILYDDSDFNVNYTADCGTVSATVVSGSDWITGITVYDTDVTFDITSNTSTTNTRSGSVKLYLVDDESCSASTTVTQGKAPVTCYCSALTLSDTSVSVNAGASTSVTYSANCVSISSIAASSTGITIDTGTTGTIKITGNTSGDYTITIKSSADGTTCTDKTISVKVNCGTIAISPKDSSGDSSGSTVNFSATYTP